MSDIRIPKALHGIIGYPLSQSLSPLLHNWAFQEHGIPAVYMAWPMQEEQLEVFVGSVKVLPINGVSVTIPHKEAIIDHVEAMTDAARKVGAVNTLYWDDGVLTGDNTDLDGFLQPLRDLGEPIDSALVLGGGGAARAVVAGLVDMGAEVAIANRTRSTAEALASEFGCEVVDWGKRSESGRALLVNTTPLGMTGKYLDDSPMDPLSLPRFQIVYDLIYNPIMTRLLSDAAMYGCKVVTGLDMFVGQGMAQFSRWTNGKTMDAIRAREILSDHLAR
jgi:shikimate dehydrogenase